MLIAVRHGSRHANGMGRDPTERTAPDLFPTATIGDASAPPTKSPPTTSTTETQPQRHILPKDLPNAVKHLSDGDLDLMQAATLEEIKRRGRVPQGVQTDLQTLHRRFDVRPNSTKTQSRQTDKRRDVDVAKVPLTRGQMNAVRAAFKAGVTPTRIARQFGISQSNVRKALASDETKR
jgi:predicted DNA-binding protein (UPF0251 family)